MAVDPAATGLAKFSTLTLQQYLMDCYHIVIQDNTFSQLTPDERRNLNRRIKRLTSELLARKMMEMAPWE